MVSKSRTTFVFNLATDLVLVLAELTMLADLGLIDTVLA